MSLRVLVACVGLAACVGPAGPVGPAGEPGAQGATGPSGVAAAPRLTRLSPDWGSAASLVTLEGEGFSTTLSDNLVTFDGRPATVLSATPTQLQVRPDSAALAPRTVVVNVEVGRQASNGLGFQHVPSGTPRDSGLLVPSAPTGVVKVGADLYVASWQYAGAGAGLYRVDAQGVTRRVWAARPAHLSLLPVDGLIDAPLALATDGTDVWFTSVLGFVRRFHVATQAVSDVARFDLGDEFPQFTGLALDANGTLFVADRAGGPLQEGSVRYVLPAGSTGELAHASLAGARALAVDGVDLFVTRHDGTVTRVRNPTHISPAYTQDFATGTDAPWGVTVLGSLLVVSHGRGLATVDKAVGGALQPWGAPGDALYESWGLFASGGTVWAAQPEGGLVRAYTPAGNTLTVTTVAAGLRLAFGTVRFAGRWYLATAGSALFSTQLAGPDSALLEVSDDGASRVVAQGRLFAGLTALRVDGVELLAVSDCLAQEVFTLDPSTGARVVRLDASDALSCPAGLTTDAAGALLYVDSQVLGMGESFIGRWTPAVHTPRFVTGLHDMTLQAARLGDELYALGFGPSGSTGLFRASATAGGAAEEVLPFNAVEASALGAGPGGRVFVGRFTGELLELRPGTLPRLDFFGTDTLFTPPGSGPPALMLSFGVSPDGALLVPDAMQQALVAVAP